MSWIQVLCDTYDNNRHMVGKIVEGKLPLAPIFHIIASAQIEITINDKGEFIRATTVPKEDRATIIPVTEDSAGRANAPAAHPLEDMLPYLAHNYSDFSKSKRDADKYSSYINELGKWASDGNAHRKVRAVFRYVNTGTLIDDLETNGILKFTENGDLSDEKIEGTPYEKCLVRWRIQSDDDENEASWQDDSLFNNYINYCANSVKSNSDICYVSGKPEFIMRNHPKGIVSSSYGAKLISAQKNSDFVYRGRFESSDEAFAVSAIASQKAHNALRWLVSNQAVRYGDRTFLCWNPKGKSVPSPCGGDFIFNVKEEEDEKPYTEPVYRKHLYNTLQGYRNALSDNDDIITMSMEAATTGRLSITYYNELKASDFLSRIESWYNTCCWYFIQFDADKKPFWIIKKPS